MYVSQVIYSNIIVDNRPNWNAYQTEVKRQGHLPTGRAKTNTKHKRHVSQEVLHYSMELDRDVHKQRQTQIKSNPNK